MNNWYCEGRSSTLVPVRIDALEDTALNWAVAFCIGMTDIADYTASLPHVRMVNYDVGGSYFLTAGWHDTSPNSPHYWEPLKNWKQLGELIDKYGMCYTYTARDHESQRISAFCPGHGEYGRAYASERKTAMLRALVSRLQESEEILIPIDILKISNTYIDPDVKALFPEFPVPEPVVYEPMELDNDF